MEDSIVDNALADHPVSTKTCMHMILFISINLSNIEDGLFRVMLWRIAQEPGSSERCYLQPDLLTTVSSHVIFIIYLISSIRYTA